ncbi:YqeB family protein [Pseudonocardia sp. CA-107938]|uniref:YqeB family protein n=1 Tax=Pseudonocardia sp. CA-107938 TaxID=3240021 RepID=UPI003D8CA208
MNTVRLPAAVPWGLAALVTAVGVGGGFVVAPVVRWLLRTVDSAPGPLRLLATLPTGWAVLVTGLLGLVAGVVLAGIAHAESPEVTVDGDHVQLSEKGRPARWIGRAEIRGVLRDGRDLVLLDHRGTELDRVKVSDLPAARLRAAFTDHGYPWRDDPDYGAGFAIWVDGRPDVPAEAHALLRERGRALERKELAAAADLRADLRGYGVAVRDRDGKQEIRAAG